MFTTGSKLLIGSAAMAAVSAVIYGIAQGGTLGTLGLISAAAALAMLGGINVYARDSNVSSLEPSAFETSPAARPPAGGSLWPMLTALGATTITLGLVTYRAIFVLGVIAIAAGAIEWMVQAWSERASADGSFNARARGVVADPLELPVAGAAGAGVVVYAFSRVMLGLPSKSSTVAAFAIVAALVLAAGVLVGLRRGLSKPAMTGAFSIAAVALIAAGAVAGLNGERETHAHETTADLAEEGLCGTEETEADERASQSVASKANLAAEVTFDGDTLSYDVPGYNGEYTAITLARANPSNVLFRNESDGPARLVLELHPERDQDGELLGPEALCTALVEEDGMQLLTVVVDRPSFAVDGGYEFVVAGSDATLEVVVP